MAGHRIPAERQHRIHRLAEEQGIIAVAELSSLLSVSAAAPIEAVDVLVTDQASQEDYRGELGQAGVRIIVASTESL